MAFKKDYCWFAALHAHKTCIDTGKRIQLSAENLESMRAENAELSRYITNLVKRPQRAWFHRKHSEPTTVTIAFTTDSDGRALYIRIVAPSDFQHANEVALRAVNNASPFGPPPFADLTFDVQVTFGSRADWK